jgi:hypothetical protein
MQPLLPYVTQNISIIALYKDIFTHTEFLIKIKCYINVIKTEGNYSLLKFFYLEYSKSLIIQEAWQPYVWIGFKWPYFCYYM